MNPVRILKSALRQALPLSLQLRLRRYVLARRIVRESVSSKARAAGLRAIVKNGDSVFDIGANAGEFSVALSLIVGPSGTVCAFEPVPETYDVLTEVVRLARLRNVRTYCVGLGERSGPVQFVIPERPAFAGYYQAHLAAGVERGRLIIAEMRVLDELIASGAAPRPSFLKVDVEGHELSVLRGATGLIDACHPSWLLEVSSATSQAVFSLLLGRGYSAWHWRSHSFCRVSQFEDLAEPDYLFVHSSHPFSLESVSVSGPT
jgi:FkbM family methyltransferase